MHEAVALKTRALGPPEGWDEEEEGRGFGMGDTCTPVADSCQCLASKVISLQLK